MACIRCLAVVVAVFSFTIVNCRGMAEKQDTLTLSGVHHEDMSSVSSRAKRQTSSTEKYTNCGGFLTGATGHFYTPFFPYFYPNNTDCTWTITVPPPYTQIKIDFIPRFHTEDPLTLRISNGTSFDICFDSFSIHDGPSADHSLLIKACGLGAMPTQYSTSRHLTVRFRSDSRDSGPGFLAIFAGLRNDGTTACVDRFTHGHTFSGKILK